MPIDVGGDGRVGGVGPSETSSGTLGGPSHPRDFEMGSPIGPVSMPDVAEVAAAARPALSRAEAGMLSAVHQLREELHRLVPAAEAARLEDALSVLVPKVATGQAEIEAILAVVEPHESVRAELSRLALGGMQDRSLDAGGAPGGGGFNPLPGTIDPSRPPKFVCPRYRECGSDYFRHTVLEPVPVCVVHGLQMVSEP